MRNFHPLTFIIVSLVSLWLPIAAVADNITLNEKTATPYNLLGDSISIIDIIITNEDCGSATTYAASASITGGVAPFTYQWSSGDTLASVSGLAAASHSVTITDSTNCIVIDTFTIASNILEVRISESLPATSLNVADGAATLVASGGTAPYTYEWDNGVTTPTNTTLSSGTHSVTVTDSNNCTASTTFSTVFSALNVIVSGSRDAKCNGGSDGTITVTTSDGASPYSYNWSNGDTTRTATGLSRGTYTVTVTDANGLTGVLDAGVIDGDPIFFNMEIFPPTCATLSDGRVRMFASGGKEPYLYDIGVGLTPVGIVGGIREGVKNYRIFAADGCTADTSFTMVAASPGLPNPSFEVEQNGLTVTITNTSTNEPTNYIWEFGEETTTTFPNPGVFEYPDTGSYTLCLTASNFCGSAQTCQELVFEPGQVPGLSLNIGRDTSNLNGTIITVPVTAGALNNLQAIQGTFQLSNPAVANIVSVSDFNLPGLDSTSFSIEAGSFTIDWEKADSTASTIEEGTVLFNLAINLTGEPGTCTQILGGGEGGNLVFTSLFEGNIVNTPFVINSSELCVSRLISITGNVHRIDNTVGVENVELTLSEDNFFVTDQTGNYSFGGLPEGNTFTITPNKSDALLNGVTTLDLVRTLQHILTASLLETPYQIIAADIDNSGAVNSLDLVYLQQALLQKRSTFPNNGSWRFVPEEFMFTDPTNPFADDFPESLTLIRQELDETNADFIAIKVGDVTLSVGNKSALKAAKSIPVKTKNKTFKKGDTVILPFTIDQESAALGMQIGLAYNTNTLIFDELIADNKLSIDQHNIEVKDGNIKIVWLNTNRMPIGKAKAGHFQLAFTAKADGQVAGTVELNNTDFKTELYKDAASRIEVVAMDLQFEEKTPTLFTVEPVQNEPVTHLMMGEAGACGDGIDNDGDGLVDCADGDCFCECQDTTNTADCSSVCEGFMIQTSDVGIVCGSALTNVSLSTTGGSGAVTYSTIVVGGDTVWDGEELADISAGTYIITAHDSMGCTAVDTFIIEGASVMPSFTFTLDETGLFVADNSTNNPTEWAWTFGEFGTSSSATQGLNVANINSSFDVCLTTTNSCGTGTSCQTIEIEGNTTMDMDTTTIDMDTTTTGMDMDTLTMVIDTTTTDMDIDTMMNEQIIINAITRNADCNEDNGSIILTVSGGVLPYTYTWGSPELSGSFLTGLAEGTYNLTVTDAENNIGTSVIEIGKETIIIDTDATIFIPDCSNDDVETGSIQIAALGGTAPYTYLLNDVASTTGLYTSIPSGGYLLTIRDTNGCAAIYSLELPGIDANPAFAFEEINNSIQFTDISNNTPSSWSWTFGDIATSDLQNPQLSLDGITAPIEVCLTTTNLCGSAMACQMVNLGDSTIVDTVTIAPVDTMTAAALEVIAISTEVSCNGNDGSITITPVGGTSPYTYTWSTPGLTGSSVSNLVAGNYMVTVTDADGTRVTNSIDLEMTAAVNVDLGNTQITASCSGDVGTGEIQLSATGGIGGYTYSLNGQQNTTGVYSNLLSGTYFISIMDEKGCTGLDTLNVPAASQTPTFTFLQQESQIIFTDISNNSPTSWSWAFGNIATSTAATQPLNIVGLTGVLEVCLTTENACGTGVSCQTIQLGNTPIDTTGMDMDTMTVGMDTMVVDMDTMTVVTDTMTVDMDTMTVDMDTTINSALSISLNITNSNCQGGGGAIEVVATGGQLPYSYNWNIPDLATSTATNLNVGGYSVTVTDAVGTTVTATTVLEMGSDIRLDASSVISPSCSNTQVGTGALQFVATGGTAPYTYNLNNSISETGIYSGLFAGTYFLSIQDASGCTTLDTIMIPSTDGTPSFTFVEMENSIVFTDATTNNPTSWSWTFGNVATSAAPSQALNIDGIEGPFEVCLTTTNACGMATFCETLMLGTSIDTMNIDTTGMGMDTMTVDMDTMGMDMDTMTMDMDTMGMDMDTMTVDMDTMGMDTTDAELDTTLVRPTVNLSIENLTRVTSDTISLAVSASGFTNILSYQYSIQIANSSDARIIGISDFNLEGLSANNFFQVNDQTWTNVWYDPTAMGISVPDGTNLFTVQMIKTNSETDCIELVLNSNRIPVQLIMAQGNAIVEGIVEVSNGSACTSEARSIFGTIETEIGVPVRDVSVAISNDSITTTTGVDGFYSFNQIPIAEEINIIPTKDGDYLTDVTTFDLVLMNRHILNIATLDSPYKIIAADVNKSSTITAFDLVLIQRLILGLNQDFPGNSSWRFIPASYEFMDPTNPFAEDFPELLTVNGFSGDLGNQDFIGVKVADVSYTVPNGSFAGTATNRSAKNLSLSVTNQEFELGTTINVPIKAANLKTYSGFQFAVSFDPSILEFESLSSTNGLPLSTNNISYQHISKGKLLVSWVAGVEQPSNIDQLFELTFATKGNGSLKELITLDNQYLQSESYTQDLQVTDVTLSVEDAKMAAMGTINIYPNPSKGIFIAEIPSELIQPTEIIVYTLTGQQVLSVKGLDIAEDQYTIDLSNQSEGTYIVMIKGEESVEVQRVVVGQ